MRSSYAAGRRPLADPDIVSTRADLNRCTTRRRFGPGSSRWDRHGRHVHLRLDRESVRPQHAQRTTILPQFQTSRSVTWSSWVSTARASDSRSRHRAGHGGSLRGRQLGLGVCLVPGGKVTRLVSRNRIAPPDASPLHPSLQHVDHGAGQPGHGAQDAPGHPESGESLAHRPRDVCDHFSPEVGSIVDPIRPRYSCFCAFGILP